MTTLISQLEDQGALFNVRKEKIMTAGGSPIDNRVAIVNEDTGGVVGLVSPKYNIVTNREVAEHLSEALDVSDLDLDGMEASVKIGYGGARAMVDVVLPKHEIDMGGDKSQLRITVLNSYDGRWKYMSRAGAVRLACMNGQILGNFVGSYTEYHNSRLDVKQGAKQLIEMADGFTKAEKWWTQMYSRKIDNEQLLRSIAVFLTGATKIDDREAFTSKPSVKRLVELFETYSAEMGRNAYALYNAMTDFVTHRKYREDSGAAALFKNEQRLSDTIARQKIFEMV